MTDTTANRSADSLQLRFMSGLVLRMSAGGRLLPWLGPALRGIVNRCVKNQICLQPEQERETRWKHCEGCEYLADCTYGFNFDFGDTARLLIVSPYFPVPAESAAGLSVPVRITATGISAVQTAGLLLRSLPEGGRRGIGDDRVPFELLEDSLCDERGSLAAADLPFAPDALRGVIPRLGIGLTAPLFLRLPRGDRRRSASNQCPQLADLLRVSIPLLESLFHRTGQSLDVDGNAFLQRAGEIRMIDHCYEPFSQGRSSSRSRQRYQMDGVTGGAVFENVPLSFLPWLLWAGRLHTGGHRSAGAGSWRLVLD